MADLADLDTSQIGIIAFWNALDNGANSVSPADALEDSNVTEWSSADNGVEGKWNLSRGGPYQYTNSMPAREINFRVKTDGWHIVWFDRSNGFNQNVSPDSHTQTGYYDLVDNIFNSESPNMTSSLPTTRLSKVLNTIRQRTCDGNETFSHGDVGHYCYEYEATTNFVTLVEERGGSTSNYSYNGSFSYDSSLNIQYHAVCAGENSITDGIALNWNGNSLISTANRIGSYNAAGETTSGTTYSNGGSWDSSQTDEYNKIVHLLLHS
ncbi:hypothetical protein [Natrinema versiforme]|uniref:Uncharacterized protein n=2 Tax=root TaxID=1 RepID=A0A4P8WP08_9EURY|nr:hypothetical protein [Natrinema versiforme]YP_010772693.1 hypothetical protein QIT49_gp26 [Natrinema versiforme icosahedral virus 1]QCS45115.1 hypothetical protein FEJ81_22865 [Natrinema versiforme]DAC85276.1 TPA_asm: hypothetical protein NVIV1gp11 [Natrinema versiforme icosahedral virus 1]